MATLVSTCEECNKTLEYDRRTQLQDAPDGWTRVRAWVKEMGGGEMGHGRRLPDKLFCVECAEGLGFEEYKDFRQPYADKILYSSRHARVQDIIEKIQEVTGEKWTLRMTKGVAVTVERILDL